MKKLIDDIEYKRFIAWAEDHYNDVVEGTYIQAYLKQRKSKITDW